MRELVDEALRDADLLVEAGSWRTAINRAYYAMFYGAQLYLRTRHFDEAGAVKTHRGTSTKFPELAIRRDGLDLELGRALDRIGNDRGEFDYDFGSVPTREDAVGTLATARWFAQSVLTALEGTV